MAARQHADGNRQHDHSSRITRAIHARTADPALKPGEASLLELQRSAGNAATTGALQQVTVQRHASFEHTLLGNTPPGRLGQAAVTSKDRNHLLGDLWKQAIFFVNDPFRDPRQAFPDIRWIKLRTSGLWVSYGELNALADYLPDSQHIDGLSRDIVLPVLQRMRSGTTSQVFTLGFRGQAGAGGWELVPPVASEKAMAGATERLGANQYFGLVAKNACHFAPYSWHRWARFHEEAEDHARAHHRTQADRKPLKDIDTDADEHLRQAWLKNGYGDHFLQDSFAAGHLINKTLVMQWFVDYVNGLSSKWWDLLGRMWWGDDTKPWYGMPDDDVMESMSARQQPGMSARGLYNRPTGNDGTTSMDRALGESVTDPQSAWERGSHDQRVAGSGVAAGGGRTREQNYQIYLKFLNSTFLQLAAGMTHDYFNERGLTVGNDNGDVVKVGGDSTLLTESDRKGAELAARAAQLSQQAIDELSKTGTTTVTIDKISRLFPNKVYEGGTGDDAHPVPLERWHDDYLHQVCVKKIFPDVVDSFNSKVARAGQSELVEGGFRDVPTPPPHPTNLGDFELPAGSSHAG